MPRPLQVWAWQLRVSHTLGRFMTQVGAPPFHVADYKVWSGYFDVYVCSSTLCTALRHQCHWYFHYPKVISHPHYSGKGHTCCTGSCSSCYMCCCSTDMCHLNCHSVSSIQKQVGAIWFIIILFYQYCSCNPYLSISWKTIIDSLL